MLCNTASQYTRLPPWPCGMDGHHQTSHQSVTAAATLPWNTHSYALKAASPPSGTSKSITSWPTSSQKYAVRSALNPTCNQPRQTSCPEPLPTHRIERGLMYMYQQMECGVGDLRKISLTCEGSTPMSQPTRTRHLPHAVESMREGKNEPVNGECTCPSLHLFSQPP